MIKETFKYTQDYTDQISKKMVTLNMLFFPVEEFLYNGSLKLQSRKRIYTDAPLYLSAADQSSVGTAGYRTDQSYEYDKLGNLCQYKTSDEIVNVLLWGYNSQYPIAKITNATYSQITAIISIANLEAIAKKGLPPGIELTL